MIFQHTADWVFGTSPHTGKPKTQTSRRVKAGEFATYVKRTEELTGVWKRRAKHGPDIHEAGEMVRAAWTVLEHSNRLVYVVHSKVAADWFSKTYAVQPGHGKHAIGRIKITSIRLIGRAGDIDQEEAEAEGFSDPEMFRELWARMYGAKALDEPRWALTIEPVGGTER